MTYNKILSIALGISKDMFNLKLSKTENSLSDIYIDMMLKMFWKEQNDILFAKISEGEYILGVAMLVQSSDGKDVIFSLPRPHRHHELFALRCEYYGIDIPGKHYYYHHKEHQGFYTNKRKFLTRPSALSVAEAAGQIREKTMPECELFSEDVW